MPNPMRPAASSHQGFRVFLIAMVILGGILRFLYLDQKLFWHDEVATAARIAGYTGSDFMANMYTGQVISVADILHFQHLNPERGVTDVIQSLVTEDIHHPPLYYVLLHYWARVWGDAIGPLRSLSAVFSVIAFPALYWLCLELFTLPLVGWIAMAMMAVSPFYLLYAQEAREYSLWLLMTLLATAALLRAIRVNHWQTWVSYSLMLTLSCYTFLFSLMVAVGHALYILLTQGRRVRRAYGWALGCSLLLFSPWLWLLVEKLAGVQENTRWTQKEITSMSLVQAWGHNISRLFLDGGGFGPGTTIISGGPTAIIMGCLSLCALFFCCQQTPKQVWLVPMVLIAIIPLCLVIPDVLGGGMRSTIARYFVPSYIGLGLVWAYLLGSRITQTQGDQAMIWQGVTVGLLTIGLTSCLHLLPAQLSWNKGMGDDHPQTAALINQSPHPLLVSSDASALPADVVSLTYLLEGKVKLQLVTEPDRPDLPSGFSHIFVFQPSPQLRSNLQSIDQTQLKQITSSLWALQHS